MNRRIVPMTDLRRENVVRRIRQLSVDKLGAVEDLLDFLECGDLSPLSDSPSPQASTSNAQRLAARVAAETRDSTELPHSKDWLRAPIHRISEHGTYIVTAGTYQKGHCFRGRERLEFLQSALLRTAKQLGWQLEAWAVFSNHYHFVAHSQQGCVELNVFLKQLHGETARTVNSLDRSTGRRVWHNYWDTKLTFERSYLARLNYVHQNPVKHGLVPVANQYRWCSAAWFERTAAAAQVKTVYRFKIDKVRVNDGFEPI